MRWMKRLLLAQLALILISSSPAIADLGPAETDVTETFDAYCGKVGNKCKVTFEEGKMRVNNGKGITRDQLLRSKYMGPELYLIWQSPEFPWVLSYRNSSGEIKTAKIIFKHNKTAGRFRQALEVFSGPTRELGPSVEVEIKN